VRTFALGAASIALALFLAGRGLSAAQVGAVLTATLVEDAVVTMLAPLLARRVGTRAVLVTGALVLAASGLLLAASGGPALAVAAMVLGIVGPAGQDAGPFGALEQALLPETVPPERRTRAFAWYSIAGYVPPALGALCAGAAVAWAQATGRGAEAGYRLLFAVQAMAGLVLAAVYGRLPAPPAPSAPAGVLGLGRSRRVVAQLAALQSLDALAGGFVVQALLVYWFHLRFGVGPELLGPLFFGTNLLSAVSFLVAARVAERIGLLNTMVFTHLPSNVLLMLVPLAGSFEAAALLLLARHLLAQMDVPARQAYVAALVDPGERAAAAALTTSARGLAQAVSPALAGRTLAGAGPLPFWMAGGLKIVYDLALYFRFRRLAAAGYFQTSSLR
jgi:MFS family permease